MKSSEPPDSTLDYANPVAPTRLSRAAVAAIILATLGSPLVTLFIDNNLDLVLNPITTSPQIESFVFYSWVFGTPAMGFTCAAGALFQLRRREGRRPMAGFRLAVAAMIISLVSALLLVSLMLSTFPV